MKKIGFDPEKCTGCKTCELVCSATHEEVFNPKKSRIRLWRTDFYEKYQYKVCRHCENPECVDVCPSDALYVEDNEVKFNIEECIGCMVCVDACPYDGIYTHPDLEYVLKCDLCNGDTNCIKYCPKDALFLEED
ncbi:MAG: 4Fe-4S dicluster domain-containing protein [Candidatus Methanofastidiosia archaeon]